MSAKPLAPLFQVARTLALASTTRVTAAPVAGAPPASSSASDTAGATGVDPGRRSMVRQENGAIAVRPSRSVTVVSVGRGRLTTSMGTGWPSASACRGGGATPAVIGSSSSATSLRVTPDALSARTRATAPAWMGTRAAIDAATCPSSAWPAACASARRGISSVATTGSAAVPGMKSWWSARVSSLSSALAAWVIARPGAPSAVAYVSAMKKGRAASRAPRFTSARLP